MRIFGAIVGAQSLLVQSREALIDPTDEDLKCFVALRDMRNAAAIGGALAGFEAWLRKASPLCATAFFKAARLCPPPGFLPTPEPAGTRPSRADEAVAPSVAPGTASSLPTAPLGRSLSIEPRTKPVQASSAEPRPSPTIIPIGYRMGVGTALRSISRQTCCRATPRSSLGLARARQCCCVVSSKKQRWPGSRQS